MSASIRERHEGISHSMLSFERERQLVIHQISALTGTGPKSVGVHLRFRIGDLLLLATVTLRVGLLPQYLCTPIVLPIAWHKIGIQ